MEIKNSKDFAKKQSSEYHNQTGSQAFFFDLTAQNDKNATEEDRFDDKTDPTFYQTAPTFLLDNFDNSENEENQVESAVNNDNSSQDFITNKESKPKQKKEKSAVGRVISSNIEQYDPNIHLILYTPLSISTKQGVELITNKGQIWLRNIIFIHSYKGERLHFDNLKRIVDTDPIINYGVYRKEKNGKPSIFVLKMSIKENILEIERLTLLCSAKPSEHFYSTESRVYNNICKAVMLNESHSKGDDGKMRESLSQNSKLSLTMEYGMKYATNGNIDIDEILHIVISKTSEPSPKRIVEPLISFTSLPTNMPSPIAYQEFVKIGDRSIEIKRHIAIGDENLPLCSALKSKDIPVYEINDERIYQPKRDKMVQKGDISLDATNVQKLSDQFKFREKMGNQSTKMENMLDKTQSMDVITFEDSKSSEQDSEKLVKTGDKEEFDFKLAKVLRRDEVQSLQQIGQTIERNLPSSTTSDPSLPSIKSDSFGKGAKSPFSNKEEHKAQMDELTVDDAPTDQTEFDESKQKHLSANNFKEFLPMSTSTPFASLSSMHSSARDDELWQTAQSIEREKVRTTLKSDEIESEMDTNILQKKELPVSRRKSTRNHRRHSRSGRFHHDVEKQQIAPLTPSHRVVKRRESSEKMVKPFPIIFEGKMGEVQWRATFNIKVKDADTPLDFEPTKVLVNENVVWSKEKK